MLAPLPVPGEPLARVGGGGLLDLVDPLGLRADEAMLWLDRVTTSDRDRLIVTSIDLDHLRRAAPSDEPTEAAATHAGSAVAGETLEERLSAIWRELLGVAQVGPDDDFFDLGGHSLIAIRLMTRIKRDFGVRFDLSAIFEASTVAALAALVRAERPDIDTVTGATDASPAPSNDAGRTAAPRGQLVTIGSRGEGRPLFVVHGAGGNVLFLSTLNRALGGERPVLAFQAVGINDGEIPDVSIEAMAARYIAEMRAHTPGPYLIGGYSGGGIVALEMSRQLLELGECVEHVILFDSVPPRTPWPSRRVRWARLTGRALRTGPVTVLPFVKRNVKQSLRRFVPERAERQQEHEVQERELGYVADGSGFVNLFYYFTAAADRYQLARYDVDVTVLKADHVWPVHRDDYYWRDHVGGRLQWLSVPGDHHSMFYPEYAPALADIVRQVLRTVEQVDANDR